MAEYAVMRWLNDYNRLSVHNLKHVVEPTNIAIGTTGTAKYPGYPGLWQYRILKMGGKKEMTTWLDRNISDLEEDVSDKFLHIEHVDENRNISDQTEEESEKILHVDEKLKDQNIPETSKDKESSASTSISDQKIPETPNDKQSSSSTCASNSDQKIPETPKNKQSSSSTSGSDELSEEETTQKKNQENW